MRFEIGDEIFLTPKTIGAPAVCFQQPRGQVVANKNGPYVTVRLDGEETTRDIHINNVVKTLPAPAPAHKPNRPAKPLTLPDGMEEVTLW